MQTKIDIRDLELKEFALAILDEISPLFSLKLKSTTKSTAYYLIQLVKPIVELEECSMTKSEYDVYLSHLQRAMMSVDRVLEKDGDNIYGTFKKLKVEIAKMNKKMRSKRL